MKKNIILVLVAMAMVALASVAWAGEYFRETETSSGDKVYQYGRKAPFGPNAHYTTIVGKQQPQPQLLRCQYGWEEYSDTETTFSKCGQRDENGKLKQAYFVGQEKKVSGRKGFEDVPNPAAGQPSWTTTQGASGTGWAQEGINSALRGVPNAFIGAFAPGCNITQNGGNVSQGQATNNKLVGVNDNTNVNPIKIDNKAISGSTSAAGANVGTGKGH